MAWGAQRSFLAKFTYLAYGWAFASGRQTITTYLWDSGAAQVKHFSRYYAFLGQTLYRAVMHSGHGSFAAEPHLSRRLPSLTSAWMMPS